MEAARKDSVLTAFQEEKAVKSGRGVYSLSTYRDAICEVELLFNMLQECHVRYDKPESPARS